MWDLSRSFRRLQFGQRATPGSSKEDSSWGGDSYRKAVQLRPNTRNGGGSRENRRRNGVWNGAQVLSPVFS